MFGNKNGTPAPPRPKASDVSRIEGTLTQVIVGDNPTDPRVFVNGSALEPVNLDSLTLEIVAPIENGSTGTISGILSSYQAGSANGGRVAHTTTLFPGTVDIVASGRRVVVTCQRLDSFDGMWLGIGTRADGTITELSGVSALRVAVTGEMVTASLTWSDTGTSEDLLT